ncbi:MAG: hypothetical protein ACLVJ6_05725 [Merdibacter sp.]
MHQLVDHSATPRAFLARLLSALIHRLCSLSQLIGMAQSFVMLLIFVIHVYRSIINKRLLILLIDACCIISSLLRVGDHGVFPHHRSFRLQLCAEVEDEPRWRVNSTFYNANSMR